MERPDIRPQLREFLAWYEDLLGKIEARAIVVAPGETERLRAEAADIKRVIAYWDETDPNVSEA